MDTGGSLAALDELPQAIVGLSPVRDETGRVVDFVFDYANRVAAQVARVATGELVGRRVLEALPAFPRDRFESFVAVLDSGVALRTQIDLERADRDDSEFATRFAVSASRLGDRLLVVYEDIGARERAVATQ